MSLKKTQSHLLQKKHGVKGFFSCFRVFWQFSGIVWSTQNAGSNHLKTFGYFLLNPGCVIGILIMAHCNSNIYNINIYSWVV